MTSIEAGPTWLERLNPRNWTLVWKLVIVGLAPALLALSIGALHISDQASAAAALGSSSRLFDVRTQVSTVGDAVRDESSQASLFVAAGRTGPRKDFDAAVARTDASVITLRGALGSADLDQSATVASSQALNRLNKLAGLRTKTTDDKSVAPVQISGSYAQIAEAVDVLDRVLLREVRVPETAGLVDALTAAQNVAAQLATQHTLVGAAIRANAFQPGDTDAIVATDVQIFAQYRAYQLALTPQQLQRFGTFLDDPTNGMRQQLAATAITDSRAGRPISVSGADWDAAYSGSRAALDRATGLIRQDVSSAAAAAAQRASNLASINAVILLIGLGIGIVIAVTVARSLIRSLRVLRSAALDVAERRLPLAVEGMRAGDAPDVAVDPVPIRTRDEVGQVARAFDAVHGQAVRLAADQAALQANVSAMFVNLSRRSQALVERQLQLIEQLESNEQDADQLSNLFQLDHLATRMRRNSENLLVLAGTDLAKRNIAPVPMVDVLRAAVSEVEQYQRVVVQAPPTASIVGRAGSDLVHLLAELLDNATNFSPPDSQVVMSTSRAGDGAIVVEIADRGVGMAPHELSDANQRLGGPSTVDVSASRRMGLFVVGRLAARHGIGVRLAGADSGPGAGLTASVTVPASLVPTAVPAEVGRPIGRPVPAAVPAQGRPAPDQFGSRTDTARPAALQPAPARPAPTAEPGPDAGRLAGRPAVNGGGNGLPTRTPGSSLRPDGPAGPPRGGDNPFDAQPFGGKSGGDSPFDAGPFDDERPGADAEQPADGDRARSVAEQARLDQEAAALRDRRQRAEPDGGGNGRGNGRPYSLTKGDERRPSEDERRPPVRDDEQRAAPEGSRPGPATAPRPTPPATPRPRLPRPQLSGPPRPSAGGPSSGGPSSEDTGRPAAAPVPGPDAGKSGDGPDSGATPAPRSAEAPTAKAGAPAPPTTPSPTTTPSTPEKGGNDQVDKPDTAGTEAAAAGRNPVGQQAMALPARRPAERPTPEPVEQQRPPDVDREPAPATRAAPPPTSGPDALFAPSIPELETGSGLGDAGGHGGFDMDETTPIFEEIASAWFRSNRPIPVDYERDRGGAEDAPPPAGPDADITAPPAADVDVPEGTGPHPVRSPGPTPDAPEPQPVSAGVADAAAFSTAADEGWRAASGVEAERPDELTAAGLPKRRPRARLVPGSAGSAVLAQPVSAARSAENIRGRLSSYQQGVRQGREIRLRGNQDAEVPPTPPPAEDVDHDEES